jgi:hypothetical protein
MKAEEKEGEIEHQKEVQKEALALPAGFEWTTIDI